MGFANGILLRTFSRGRLTGLGAPSGREESGKQMAKARESSPRRRRAAERGVGERMRMGPAVAVAFLVVTHAAADEWSSWRGPHQNGVAGETGLVSSWSAAGENLAWSADFIGRSTPVAFRGRVCATGRIGDGIDKQEIVACYDAKTGEKLWEHRSNVFHTAVPFNRVGWANPVADAETGNLYVHAVSGLLTAFDLRGKILWERSLTEEFGRFSGYGGRTHSPVIDEDRVVLGMTTVAWGDQVAPKQRWYAFDKRTGGLVWISDVAEPAKTLTTYSTPAVAEIGGRRLLVGGNADGAIYAIRARTGEMVWKFRLSKAGLDSSPLVDGDRVYTSTGDEPLDEAVMGRVVCIDATGSGDVTATHEVWRAPAIKAGYASPLLKDGILYVVDDSAGLHALDAGTGAVLWTQALGTVGKGSPVWADGKIYATEVNGHFWILKPSRAGVEVLDDEYLTVEGGGYAEIYGSPAVAYRRVFFTAESGLYALADPAVPFAASAGRATPPGGGRAEPSATPARVLVEPAEAMTSPGRPVSFTITLADDDGRPLGRPKKVAWAVNGLDATVEDGKVTPSAARGGQAGTVTVTADGFEARARLRVVPAIPWSEDFEGVEVGKTPAWFVGSGTRFKVEEMGGGKVLAKPFADRGLERQTAFLGPPDAAGYTIQADVMGTRKGRRTMPDVGLVNGRYTLDMLGNHQRLQLRDWAELRFERRLEFPWEPDVWYTMKLRVDLEGDRAIVRGKVWQRDEAEPAEWTIAGEDPVPDRQGSPGLYGYSPTAIYYDNLKVTENR
jgi:outer membrane protein assembly factor BamB